MHRDDKYKGTFIEFLVKAMTTKGRWFRIIEDGDIDHHPVVVVSLEGVALKVRFNRAGGKEWDGAKHPEWIWWGQVGRAINVLEDLRARAARRELRRPKGFPKRGDEPTPAEIATDRALAAAGVEYDKFRREVSDGLDHVVYRLKKGALFGLAPGPRWQWYNHTCVIYGVVEDAYEKFRRHRRRQDAKKRSPMSEGRRLHG